DEDLERAGYPPLWIAAGRASVLAYPGPLESDLESDLARVRTLILAGPVPLPPPASAGSVRITRAVPAPPPRPAEPRRVELFLELIDSLSGKAADGYADLRDALQLARGRGLSTEHVEEILNELEETGVVEEPIVGKLRRA
ncbi:MAG TPA: hypothetical protein VJS68_02825, partial [Thermoplasmata archaeon]|nr:hypothetical protein [Thermoplasmata archaeon]